MKNELPAPELQSKTIDWLRFPLTIAVIFIHTSPNVDMQAIDYSAFSGKDVFSIIGTLGSHTLASIAVPCFFMFSGFLFFFKTEGWSTGIYLQKLKSRAMSLALPYILWNIIAVLFTALKAIPAEGGVAAYLGGLADNGIWKIFWNCNEWEPGGTDMLGRAIFNYGPACIPLWFLRELIVVVLLSPAVYYLVKYTKLYGVALLGVLYYTKIGFAIPGFSIRLFLTAMFFFSLGAYFGINKKNIVTSLRAGQGWWFALAAIFVILTSYYYGTPTKDYFLPLCVFFGVVSAVNIASSLIEKRRVKSRKLLSDASFFTFAAHGVFVLGLTNIIYDTLIHATSIAAATIRYLTIPFLCGAICVGIYYVMKRFTPRILPVLTGNR